MSTRADVLLEDFGRNLNIPDMKFDENRLCSFKVDERYSITILANNDEHVFIYALFGKLAHEPGSDIFALLLSTNLYLAEAGMSTLCYEPKNSLLILAKSYSLDGLDAVSIENIIDTLAEQVDQLAQNLHAELGIELEMV
jgi:hypothetical protein